MSIVPADECDGLLGAPRPFRLQPSPESPVKIGDAHPRRRFVIAVITVGATVWVSGAPTVRVGNGIPIPALNGIAYLIDEYPYAHKGEWYAISDSANTDILVVEVA